MDGVHKMNSEIKPNYKQIINQAGPKWFITNETYWRHIYVFTIEFNY